jgi:hypothetical protein
MKKNIGFLILMIIISSCIKVAPDSSGVPGVPQYLQGAITENGEIIELDAPKGWNNFKIGDFVGLMVRNVSEKDLVFPNDFNVKIFTKENDSYIEISNKTAYPSSEEVVLEPNPEFDAFKIHTLIVYPDIAVSDSTAYLRIFISGVLMENGKSSETVATYIDVTLYP